MTRLPRFLIAALFLSLAVSASAALAPPVLTAPGLSDGESGADYAALVPTFSWKAVSGATWYQVYCDTIPGGPAPLSKWVEGVTTWTLPASLALRNGQAYHWWVRAWSAGQGFGSWSTGMAFTAKPMRSLFIPASAFRPVSGFTPWQFAGSGTMISSSGTNPGDFVAPIEIPVGSTITDATVRWKNNVLNNGYTWCSMRWVSNATGAYLDLLNITSTAWDAGMMSAATGNGAAMMTSENFHILATVGTSNSNRWILGVTIDYFEP